jgi:hypothetical protein
MTYLILHKVRGKPAFDVAECCKDMGTEADPGPWWIISTSGHRAYPYEVWPLSELLGEQLGEIHEIKLCTDFNGWLKDWPDHYNIGRAPKQDFNIMSVVSNLLPKIKRRL